MESMVLHNDEKTVLVCMDVCRLTSKTCESWIKKKNENATIFGINASERTLAYEIEEEEPTEAHCVLAVILAIWKIEIKILDKHDKVKNKDAWCFIQRSILCKCGYNCSMDSATNRRTTPFFPFIRNHSIRCV